MTLSIAEYQKRLDRHDWLFEYADDLHTWRKGRFEQDELIRLSKDNPALRKLYEVKECEVLDSIINVN